MPGGCRCGVRAPLPVLRSQPQQNPGWAARLPYVLDAVLCSSFHQNPRNGYRVKRVQYRSIRAVAPLAPQLQVRVPLICSSPIVTDCSWLLFSRGVKTQRHVIQSA